MMAVQKVGHGMNDNDHLSAKELKNCYFVKTILMIIIVFYHSILFWRGDWFASETPVLESEFLHVLSNWLSYIHNYAFVFVSGYIYYYSRYEAGKYCDYLGFIKNKTQRLLVPYIFVSIAWVAPISAYIFNYSANMVFSKYILGIEPGHLWFLLMLFNVFTLFFIISDFCKDHIVMSGMCVCILWGISLVGEKIFDNYYRIWSALSHIPYFWLGFTYRQVKYRINKNISSFAWFVLYTAMFVVMVPMEDMVLNGFMAKGIRIVLGLVIRLFGAMMAFSVLQNIAGKVDWKNSRFFMMLSRYSMVVYLFHEPIIYFFIKWFNGTFKPWTHATIIFVGTMAVCLAISAIMLKFKWTRVLVGENKN